MRSGDIVEIIYQAKDGRFSRRHIRVINDGEKYLEAYCYMRKNVRIFKKENILAENRIKRA